ncbi:MAG: hypothetical protein Q8R91_02590, partial [Candidatus Omnitrophota bacterium]|nr:hypothetical protein [Candidatus Omnitrophota bacterium]
TASNYLPLAGGTLTGNLVIPNAGTIGQAAGPLLTFDDAANELEISGGNVGIGTASPNQKLEVGGHLRLNGDGTYEILYMQTDAVFTKVSADKRLLIQPGGDVAIRDSGGVDRILMKNSTGNIGIGTASPGAKLDIAGGDVALQTAQKIILDSNDTGDASNSYLVHDAANDRVSIYVDGLEMVRINK